MPKQDRRKQSLYFPDDLIQQIESEAIRLDRSMSWVVQQAWLLAYEHICTLDSHADVVKRLKTAVDKSVAA